MSPIPLLKNNRASCLGRMLVGFIIAGAITAYSNPYLRGRIHAAVEAYVPDANTTVRQGLAKALAISQDLAGKIKDYSQVSIKKGQEYFHAFRLDLDSKKPLAGIGKTFSLSHPDAIKVCSFNIRIFSDRSRSDAELKNIAQILKYYDLVAIQELRDEKVLRRTVDILAELGHTFEYEISPPVGRGVKEKYAFLYRPDKIRLKASGKLYPDDDDKFVREPFYAAFEAGDFDFILLTIHVLYGDYEAQRRLETAQLAKVYRYVQADNPSEKDIILLGDFNLSPMDYGWEDLKLLPSMAYLIGPPAKTTITDTSLYDNFWFQKHYVKEYSGKSGVVKFDESIFANDDQKARIAVSDHRPIWADFHIGNGDDD